MALKCRPEIEAQTYEMAVQHDAFRHLGEVQCPVTIAVGGAGDFGPAAFGPAVAAPCPSGRLVSFDDLGHFGPLEDPPRWPRPSWPTWAEPEPAPLSRRP